MAGYYKAKSRQQLLHLPAVWLIKTHYLLAHQNVTQAVCKGRRKRKWNRTLLAAHLQVCSTSCRANPDEDVGGTSPAKSALSNAQY